jgi:sugar lactone lactonase YvrE
MFITRNRVIGVIATTTLALALTAQFTPNAQADITPQSATTALYGDQSTAAKPTTVTLPAGFALEGMAIGKQPYAYLGNRVNGDIYRADLRTGQGEIITHGPGTPSNGMTLDNQGRLFVAGAAAGNARVINTATGAVIASYTLSSTSSLINDVTLTKDAAYFTDSFNPVLYRLPLGRNGAPSPTAEIQRIPLTGAIVYSTTGTSNSPINANGITTTPDGKALLIGQMNTGLLFRVDPTTGVTTAVNTGGKNLTWADGMLRTGRTLYVAENRLNAVAVLTLNTAGTRAALTREITDTRFDIPTTIATYENRLYMPNSRFTTPVTPDTAYTFIAISRP